MADQVLSAVWETESLKGHPRKFYSLTREGSRLLDDMKVEFNRMLKIYEDLGKDI
jgi:DNA-binding PadR family transcriptional regulator